MSVPVSADLARLMAAVLLGLGLVSVHAAAQDGRPGEAPGTLGMTIGIDALRWQDQADLEAAFADLEALGAQWLRTDINWSLVQPQSAEAYDWRVVDRIVDLAERHGLRLLPVVGSVPDWARRPAVAGEVPFDPAAFGRFVAAAVARYQPRGLEVWEIWNEPNMTGSWPGAPDPVAFAAVLQVAAAAVKSVDPQARVVAGSLAPAPDTGPAGAVTHVAAVDFLTGVYGAGGGASFDAVGFHPYSWPLPPAKAVSWNGWAMMAGPIRALMAAHGDEDKPVWITEYGAPTNRAGVAEAAQADMLQEATQLARGYPWAGPLFFYSYRDLGTDPTDNEDWYGLVRSNGLPKPAYEVFRSLASETQAVRE